MTEPAGDAANARRRAAIAGFLVGLMTFAIQAVGAIVDIKRVDLDKALIVEAVASILIGFFVSIVVRSGVRSAFRAASTAQLSARNRIVAPGIRSDTDGTLGIRREPSYRDRLRSYDVNVDGQTVGEIAQDSSHNFQVPAGQHDVSLHIDWCRSPTVTVDLPPGGCASLVCRPSGSPWRVFWDATLARNRYIVVEIVSPSLYDSSPGSA